MNDNGRDGVRRVVIQHGPDGYRWKAQGKNWRTIDASRKPVARESTARRQVADRFPDAEVIVT